MNTKLSTVLQNFPTNFFLKFTATRHGKVSFGYRIVHVNLIPHVLAYNFNEQLAKLFITFF